jgi:hypothetical protein
MVQFVGYGTALGVGQGSNANGEVYSSTYEFGRGPNGPTYGHSTATNKQCRNSRQLHQLQRQDRQSTMALSIN